jgi:hypothetical protein
MKVSMIFNVLHTNIKDKVIGKSRNTRGTTREEMIFRAEPGDLVLFIPPK